MSITRPLVYLIFTALIPCLGSPARADPLAGSFIQASVRPILNRYRPQRAKGALPLLEAVAQRTFPRLTHLHWALLNYGEYARWNALMPEALKAAAPGVGIDRARAEALHRHVLEHPYVGMEAERRGTGRGTCAYKSLAARLEAGRCGVSTESMRWAWIIREETGYTGIFHRALAVQAAKVAEGTPGYNPDGWWIIDAYDGHGGSHGGPHTVDGWLGNIEKRYGSSMKRSLVITDVNRSTVEGPQNLDAHALVYGKRDQDLLMKAIFNHHNYLSGQPMLP